MKRTACSRPDESPSEAFKSARLRLLRWLTAPSPHSYGNWSEFVFLPLFPAGSSSSSSKGRARRGGVVLFICLSEMSRCWACLRVQVGFEFPLRADCSHYRPGSGTERRAWSNRKEPQYSRGYINNLHILWTLIHRDDHRNGLIADYAH